MRQCIALIALCMIALAASGPCSAGEFGFMADYGPFESAHYPRNFPMKELRVSIIKDGGNEASFGMEYGIADFRDEMTVTRVLWKEGGCVILITCDGVEHSYADERSMGTPSLGIFAWSADLNSDGLQDLIIITPAGACGIGGAIAGFSFLLSNPDGFRHSFLAAFTSDESSFVDLDGDGKPEFILSSFIYGEEGQDGKKHNYFVYNLLKFEGDEIVSANAIDKRFPSWIWYSFKPNHRNTDQLTSEQRMRLWRERHQEDYDKLPIFKELEKEQAILK